MNEFGTTAWGRAWLRLAEPLRVTRPNPQLPRARSLARNDRVGQLTMEAGAIAARVDDGSGRTVRIAFPVWSAPPEVGADGLDEAVVDHLAARGTPVAPEADDLDATCGCAPRDGRCRHILAVVIEVARRVDETPALAFTLRGAPPPRPAAPSGRLLLNEVDVECFWRARRDPAR